MAASRKRIDENAQMSCEREPGCRRLLVPSAANDRIFFYEICDSRAAFGTHLPSPHLATFNTTSADWS
jgi:quinol monooxygenase YgiN